MGYTLLEMRKSASPRAAVYIEEYEESSDILRAVEFRNIEGNAYNYNREHTLPGVGFRGYNEGFPNTRGVINPQSEAMKMAGGDLDVDLAIIATQGSAERRRRELMQVKSLAHSWTRSFIKGNESNDYRSFDGLQRRLTGTQVIDIAPSGGALSLTALDETIDLVDNPTHLIMSKTMRRKLSQASRNTSVSGFITTQKDEMGHQVEYYQGIPILIAWQDNNDAEILGFTEASGDETSTNNTSIYCVSFMDGMVEGLNFRNNEGGFGISVRDLGELETLPVARTRIDWHTTIAVQHGRSAARLRGIKNQAVVS